MCHKLHLSTYTAYLCSLTLYTYMYACVWKVDKASILEDAIAYLKTLQLQLQVPHFNKVIIGWLKFLQTTMVLIYSWTVMCCEQTDDINGKRTNESNASNDVTQQWSTSTAFELFLPHATTTRYFTTWGSDVWPPFFHALACHALFSSSKISHPNHLLNT